MYCPKCGTQVADDAKFCASCGAPLPTTANRPPQPAQPAPSSHPPQPPQPQAQPMAGTDGAPQPPHAYAPTPSAPTPSAVTPSAPLRDAPQAANPEYQAMGGWFLVFLICFAVAAVSYVVDGFRSFSVASQLGYLANLVGAGWAVALVYVASILMILCGVLLLYTCYLALSRKPSFLRFFQIVRIIDIAAPVIVAIVYGMMYLSTGELWGSAVGSAIGLLLLTYYFCKSVRVRTYMGSEDYMDQALFTLGR